MTILLNVVCEILAKVRRKWVTICRFVPYENLDDILTMFRVNLAENKKIAKLCFPRPEKLSHFILLIMC